MVSTQAACVANLEQTNRAHAEFERDSLKLKRESDERFARVEAKIDEIIHVLNDHSRKIEALTEAVRERTGFKG